MKWLFYKSGQKPERISCQSAEMHAAVESAAPVLGNLAHVVCLSGIRRRKNADQAAIERVTEIRRMNRNPEVVRRRIRFVVQAVKGGFHPTVVSMWLNKCPSYARGVMRKFKKEKASK